MTSKILLRAAGSFFWLWLLISFVAPAARAQTKAHAPAQAPARAQASSIRYFCFTTDTAQPAVYFTNIFDVPDVGGDADKFVQYMHITIDFQKYLLGKYRYASSAEDPVSCTHAEMEPDQMQSIAAAMAAKKQSVETAVAAAKKQIVDTGWKFTGTPNAAEAANTPADQQRSAPPAPTRAQGGAPAANGPLDKQAPSNAKVDDALANPVIVWHMESKKDSLTDEVTTKPEGTKFFLKAQPAFFVTASATCGNNGVSIFFLAAAGTGDPVPQYSWYQDDSNNSDDSDEQVADVRMRVDSRDVHVAKGYPNEEGHTRYTNWLGLLFYEPNIIAHAAQEQEDSANTGIPALDGLLAPIVREQARNNSQASADSSAGPLTDLLNARSIRVELPLTNQDAAPVLDLNPQDKVLHQFVTDCAAKFGGRSQ